MVDSRDKFTNLLEFNELVLVLITNPTMARWTSQIRHEARVGSRFEDARGAESYCGTAIDRVRNADGGV